jgi:hypothetical protein
MSTTAKQIIEAAYSRSTFNDPDKLATNAELIGVIDRRLKQLYSIAARANPTYFGKSADVVGVASAYARPTDAELVMRIEGSVGTVTDGTEVSIVPFEDRNAEMAPVVYLFGSNYISPGGSGNPAATDTLTFSYSKRHPNLDTTLASDHSTNTLDSSWPEQFNDLLVLHVAKYLAAKDNRTTEISVLAAEEAALMEVFLRHLGHVNYGMKARWGHRARTVDPAIVSSAE